MIEAMIPNPQPLRFLKICTRDMFMLFITIPYLS